jgi:hypothetical protein
MRRGRAEPLLSTNNDLTRFGEAEHVGILAAETYFPAQYVSNYPNLGGENKANTFWFWFLCLAFAIYVIYNSYSLPLFPL